MKSAYTIEISAIIIVIILLGIFVPKNKIREALVILMFKQAMTWILGLAAVQLDWLEYPDRILFPDATQTSLYFMEVLFVVF
ncbi:CBO0543 family protein [Virgibacillus siamensis]|uniref:CBO0543 family protein n=1 Tax=Virgibacillus siamensis TaxID=480071 RepID=UPI000985A2EF|nr:CBO0543 family protein [Virgibacillus siamensis]